MAFLRPLALFLALAPLAFSQASPYPGSQPPGQSTGGSRPTRPPGTPSTFPTQPSAPPRAADPSAASASTAQQSIQTDKVNAARARKLLDQCIAALGGAAYLNFHDMQQDGRTSSFYHGVPRGNATLYWRFWQWPDKERVELTKERDWIIIHRGNTGTEITYRGARPEDPDELADFLQRRDYSLENIFRTWLTQPAVALFYDGATLAETRQVDKLTIISANNLSITLYLDTETHLPVKKSYTLRDPVSKEHDEFSEIYDNYRPIQGISTPFSVTRSRNGEMVAQRFVHSVAYNTAVPDSFFDPASIPVVQQQRKKSKR